LIGGGCAVLWALAGEGRQRGKGRELDDGHGKEQPDDAARSGESPEDGATASDQSFGDEVEDRLGAEVHAGADEIERSEKTKDAGKEADRGGQRQGLPGL